MQMAWTKAKSARCAPIPIARCTTPGSNSAGFKPMPLRRLRRRSSAARKRLPTPTGICVLVAIAAAVPVRLMKRDLLFVTERLAAMVDERRLEIVARQRGTKREKDSDSIAKLFGAYLRRADESVLGSVLVELTILLTAARPQTMQVLNAAATVYKVDTDAIAAKVKQEFAAKEKMQVAKKGIVKAKPKDLKKAKAA